MVNETVQGFAIIITIISIIATILDKAFPNFNDIFILLIEKLKKGQFSGIVESCSIFIKKFEDFYIEKNYTIRKFQNYFWAWIIISFFITISFGFISLLSNQILPLLPALTAGMVFGTMFFILYFIFIKDRSMPKLFILSELIWILLTFRKNQNISLTEDKPEMVNIQSLRNIFNSSYILALIISILFLILFLLSRFVFPMFALYFDIFPPILFFQNMNIYIYLFMIIYSCVFLFIITFYLSLFFLLTFYFISKYPNLFNISPFRTSIVSIITILLGFYLLSYFNKDAYNSFLLELNQYGYLVMFYLLLNIFADSFSILETYYLLRKASEGTIQQFPKLLVIDFFASGILFLMIPFSTGNFNVFVDAIFFKGDSPWFGILFWSTYATSILFYLYIFSISVLVIVYKYSEIDEKYNFIKMRPVFAIAFASIMIIFTILFINIYLLFFIFLIIILFKLLLSYHKKT